MKLIPSVSLKSVNCIAFTFQHGEEDFPASPPDLFHRPLIHGWSCQENTQRYRFSVICNNTRNIVEGSKRKITVSVGKQFKYNFCPRRVEVVPKSTICFMAQNSMTWRGGSSIKVFFGTKTSVLALLSPQTNKMKMKMQMDY